MNFLNWLVRLLVEIGWALDWVYLPERDAVPYIFADTPKLDEKENLSLREKFMALNHFDGRPGTPDYRQPDYVIDGGVWDEKGWNIEGGEGAAWTVNGNVDLVIGDSTQRKNYMLVRPLVVQGWAASRIARHYGKSLRWAEEYVSAVRLALWRRYSEDVMAPPLSEEE